MTEAGKLALLWDERAITRTMLDFGRALDTGDWPLHRSTFTDTILVDFGRLTGSDEVEVSADDWTRFAGLVISPVRRHHSCSNFRIEVEGDGAFATVTMTSRHWKATDLGASEYNQNGWYEVHFVRRGDRWPIARIRHDFHRVSGNNALFDMTEPAPARTMAQVFSDTNRAAAAKALAL